MANGRWMGCAAVWGARVSQPGEELEGSHQSEQFYIKIRIICVHLSSSAVIKHFRLPNGVALGGAPFFLVAFPPHPAMVPEMIRATLLLLCTVSFAFGELTLPRATTFRGEKKFQLIVAKARKEQWHKLAIGDRVVKVALELEGTPYKGFTLEIHDHTESPSANLLGLDCWTFFEISFGMARMIGTNKKSYSPDDLLRQIETTRYRGGTCRGNYLDRLHYLADWYLDNDKRGTIDDITRTFPTVRMAPQCGEMTDLWRHYRYLKNDPKLRSGMAAHERRLNRLPVFMIPKGKVAAIEPKLRNGDIIGIARNTPGSYCSHVGIIVIDRKGTRRFMHASSTYKKVVVDKSLSAYLHKFKKHAGILVGRPK